MFVTYLKENNFLCHDEKEIVFNENRQITCKICNRLILDVNKHLTCDTLPNWSSFLAKHYAKVTGDINVPCRIAIHDIPGIKPTYVEISYSNLLSAIQLLGVVNQDFIACTNHKFNINLILKNKILENFIDNYMNMIDTIQHSEDNVEKILKMILSQLKDSFNSKDYSIFDYYRNIICPYVKTFDDSVREEEVDFRSPGEYFQHLSKNATTIRNFFGKKCLPFDIIYIMIYCFTCHKNLKVVANFVFDLIARLCNKYFDEPTMYQEKCISLVNTHTGYCKDNTLYYLVKSLKEGNAADMFCLNFYNNFAQLQQVIFTEFSKMVSTPSDNITKFAFSQSFPFILFPNSANYYGFMCMMAYATSKLNLKYNTQFEKGVCANAKKIMHFIENYTKEIQKFGAGTFIKVSEIKNSSDKDLKTKFKHLHLLGDDEMVCLNEPIEYWTLDMFKLFISINKDFIDYLLDFLNLLNNV